MAGARAKGEVARWPACVAVATALLIGCLLPASATSKPRGFTAATSGNQRERVKKIPIARHAKRSRRVVFTLGPRRLPDLRAGSTLTMSGEVTLTTTCVNHSERCIGKPYHYSPEVGMRIVLTAHKGATGGHGTRPVSRRIHSTCSQRRPNRNHHCPLVVEHAKLRIPKLQKLPCKPKRCRLNMVVDASSRQARHGNVVVAGADRPDGHIDQRKGRLNAVVFRRGADRGRARKSSSPVNSRIPFGSSGSGDKVVVFSAKVAHLDRGDVLLARARQLTDIGGYPFSAFISDQLIVATSRNATAPHGLAKHAISFHGTLGAVNGFNCTQAPSGWQTPCLSRKAGLGRVQRNVERHGHDVPLFVNLVSRSFPKLTSAPAGSSARIAGGSLAVRHLRR